MCSSFFEYILQVVDVGKDVSDIVVPSNDVEAIASFNRSMERATEQLNNLVYELEAYAPGLSRKKSIVVANKLDTLILPNEFNVDEHLAMLGSCVSDTNIASPVFPVSALNSAGIRTVVQHLRVMLEVKEVKEVKEVEVNE